MSKTSQSSSQQTTQRISDQLTEINHQLRQHNSLPLSFVRGLLTGLGASIGLTVVVALLVFLITQITRILGLESVGTMLVEYLQ